jgi:hypothetical protein
VGAELREVDSEPVSLSENSEGDGVCLKWVL